MAAGSAGAVVAVVGGSVVWVTGVVEPGLGFVADVANVVVAWLLVRTVAAG